TNISSSAQPSRHNTDRRSRRTRRSKDREAVLFRELPRFRNSRERIPETCVTKRSTGIERRGMPRPPASADGCKLANDGRHDPDKPIGQLSLVAFLMAERRPLTARDVKGNVEGYSEMSDEAFARRFYSDRAELTALGVPLTSQRDEFTGEELYTLRS